MKESTQPSTTGEATATAGGGAHIDVDFQNQPKHSQHIAGDVFVSRRYKAEDRVISVLSDGLGSGVKANVLATLTATMALRYTASSRDIRKSAETIMGTLPVCSQRKISYSTFTIVDIDGDGNARIVEHGNPALLLVRGGRIVDLDPERIGLERFPDRPLTSIDLNLELGDRLVFCSDGVTQSGMGQKSTPFGWGEEALADAVLDALKGEPSLSARALARRVLDRALANDGHRPKDDVSCAVLHFRHPRRLLLASGPPFNRETDRTLAETIDTYDGRRVICGGTTASIVSRELGRKVTMDLSSVDPDIPPASYMKGVDLVTEGTLTLARVAELLEMGRTGTPPDNPAGELLELVLDSDIIDFVIGTRINEAHQDPNIPVELDLRRNIIKKIATLLEERHTKETTLRLM